MRLIIFVIALLKILQKEKHNNLCSLPHPARNSAIERLNICISGCNYKWKPSQRVSRGTALGGSAILKGRRTPQGVEYPRTPVLKFSIFIHLKAFCSKFQTFQHSLIFEFMAEDFITQVCWTFLVNLATLSSCPEMRKNFGNFNVRREGEQVARWSKPLVSTFNRKEV